MPLPQVFEESFATMLEEHEYVVLECYAPWSTTCQIAAPHLEKLSMEYRRYAAFYRMDADHEEGIAAQLKIAALPTAIVLRRGVEVSRHEGGHPTGLRKLLDKSLPLSGVHQLDDQTLVPFVTQHKKVVLSVFNHNCRQCVMNRERFELWPAKYTPVGPLSALQVAVMEHPTPASTPAAAPQLTALGNTNPFASGAFHNTISNVLASSPVTGNLAALPYMSRANTFSLAPSMNFTIAGASAKSAVGAKGGASSPAGLAIGDVAPVRVASDTLVSQTAAKLSKVYFAAVDSTKTLLDPMTIVEAAMGRPAASQLLAAPPPTPHHPKNARCCTFILVHNGREVERVNGDNCELVKPAVDRLFALPETPAEVVPASGPGSDAPSGSKPGTAQSPTSPALSPPGPKAPTSPLLPKPK